MYINFKPVKPTCLEVPLKLKTYSQARFVIFKCLHMVDMRNTKRCGYS